MPTLISKWFVTFITRIMNIFMHRFPICFMQKWQNWLIWLLSQKTCFPSSSKVSMIFKCWKVLLYGIQKFEELNSMIFKGWKVSPYEIQKFEEFKSMIFRLWKVLPYEFQKFEELKSMIFIAWKVLPYEFQKFEELKSMIFKAWKVQKTQMRALVTNWWTDRPTGRCSAKLKDRQTGMADY